MTKLIACILLICAVICLGTMPARAFAEAEYAWVRVEKNDVYLYSDERCERALFELAKSYYAEVLETLDKVYLVAVMQNKTGFPSILGYVRKIEVKPVEAVPLEPRYPTEQIVVTSDSAQLKLLPLSSSENVIVATTSQKVSYYGSLTYYGKDWYYVYCAGKFGYVEQNCVSRPNIQLHPTPLEVVKPVVTPQQPSDIDNPTADEPGNKTPTAEILLIVFVVLLAGGLTLALFLPGNGKKTDVFEQDI